MIRRPPRSTLSSSSAASDVYKRQSSTVVRKGARYRFDRRLLIAMCLLGAAAFAPSEALALCAPPGGDNVTVTGTSIGIAVGSNNTITNLGTVTTAGSGGVGDVFGINSNGTNLTVINSGT